MFTVEDAITAALDNVISFGETDVFPFPTEHHIFFDSRDAVKQLLLTIHSNFDDSLNDFPPINQSLLASAGYTGFRWVTQVDPVWNVYFLGMVIAIGAQIEHDRIPVADDTIFSYRFNLDPASHAIFDRSIGWPEFQKQSLENAKQFPNVVVCDISDFYSHIYHHRVENALNQLSTTSDAPARIMRLLQHFSGNTSYGLPVGGPNWKRYIELIRDFRRMS